RPLVERRLHDDCGRLPAAHDDVDLRTDLRVLDREIGETDVLLQKRGRAPRRDNADLGAVLLDGVAVARRRTVAHLEANESAFEPFSLRLYERVAADELALVELH